MGVNRFHAYDGNAVSRCRLIESAQADGVSPVLAERRVHVGGYPLPGVTDEFDSVDHGVTRTEMVHYLVNGGRRPRRSRGRPGNGLCVGNTVGMSDSSGFRSAEARQRYMTVYHHLRSRSPVPDAVHDVATEFGVVRVYQHGPDSGTPVVLLHCFWATSGMWAQHIPALVDAFTIYTVDMLGQPGASVQTKRMKTADHCAQCLNEVFGVLGLDRVHLVGHSYGGWTAAQTAARIPDRLASVTLIEPCDTVARVSAKVWLGGVVLLFSGAERKERNLAQLLGRPEPGSLLDSVMQVVLAAGAAFASFGTPFPRYVRDSRLRSIEVPVQLLLAGRTIHDSARGLDRVRKVAPSWSCRLWPDATHMLPCEAVEDVSACIRGFAQQHTATQ